VTFEDVQDLELVRRKLLKALLNLESNADVGRCWLERVANLGTHAERIDVGEELMAMQEHILDLGRHARVVNSLLTRLDGTRKLVGPTINRYPTVQCG